MAGVVMQCIKILALCVPVTVLTCFLPSVSGEDAAKRVVTPQNLLKLIHTPEVQRDLGFEPNDPRLMSILREIDGTWWRSRNLNEEKQHAITQDLEKQLRESLASVLSPVKMQRLREIEIQSQGIRALGRPDVSKELGLDSSQILAIQRTFSTTDALSHQLSEKKGHDPALEKEVAAAREKEQTTLQQILTNPQRVALGKLIGKPVDTTQFKRIYPLAPELIDSGEWAGGRKTTLDALHGKVVLLHFYAFQCHNCVANFEHYKRWHDTLSKKGVVVLGIQTPETPAERDAMQVRRAAKDKGFLFPVLIDLKSKNWDAWGNTMWPTVYVIDQNGYIRYWWQGELNWQGAKGDTTIEKIIDELLAE